MKRVPCLTLLFAATTMAIHSIPGVTVALQCGREAVVHGELWRGLTGHFTHFGIDHLRWDVITFIAFGSLVEIRSRRGWLLCLAVAALVISLGVGLLQREFSIYRGLSGLDSALFGFVTADLLRTGCRERDRLATGFALLALSGFLAKSLYELSTGLTLFVAPSADFETVPLAHLLGAVTGISSAVIFPPRQQSRTAPKSETARPPSCDQASLSQ